MRRVGEILRGMIEPEAYEMTEKFPQRDIFDPAWRKVPDAHFNGADYVDARDRPRLSGQIQRVHDLMADERWRTLEEIADATGDPHASVSAQLRHLRKPRFGKHTIERRHDGGGLYSYRMVR